MYVFDFSNPTKICSVSVTFQVPPHFWFFLPKHLFSIQCIVQFTLSYLFFLFWGNIELSFLAALECQNNQQYVFYLENAPIQSFLSVHITTPTIVPCKCSPLVGRWTRSLSFVNCWKSSMGDRVKFPLYLSASKMQLKSPIKPRGLSWFCICCNLVQSNLLLMWHFEAYTKVKPKTMLLTDKVNETIWSSTAAVVGSRCFKQIHHRLGVKLFLLLTTNNLKPNPSIQPPGK